MQGYRTLIFNVIMLIAGMADLVTALLPQTPISEEHRLWIGLAIAFITGVGNLVLRIWFTTTPIGQKGFATVRSCVILAFVAVLALAWFGCGSATWQGRMEDTYQLSVDTVDTVVTLFKDDPQLCPAFPRQCEEVKQIARNAPDLFRQLSDALTVFRQAKKTGDPNVIAVAKQNVEEAALKAQAAASEASAAMVKVKGGSQ